MEEVLDAGLLHLRADGVAKKSGAYGKDNFRDLLEEREVGSNTY